MTELKPCPWCGAGTTNIKPNGRVCMTIEQIALLAERHELGLDALELEGFVRDVESFSGVPASDSKTPSVQDSGGAAIQEPSR